MKRKQDIVKAGRELQQQIAKVLSDKLKLPVYVMDPEVIDNISKLMKKIAPALESHFTEAQLHKEAADLLTKLTLFRPKDERDLEKRVKKFIEDLNQEKNYEAILLLDGLIGLPIGLRIGSLEIIAPDTSRKLLLSHIKYLEEKKMIYPNNCSWARVRFRSYQRREVREELFKILELPFAILSLVMHKDLDVRDAVGEVLSPFGEGYFLGSAERGGGWSRYAADISGQHMKMLSSITQKDQPTKLEKKILQAIQVFWLSRLSNKTEIRFIMLISALESLLLTTNDRDYLGKKLSEKCAFLLETERKKRLELYKLIKKYYTKRSELVHEGKNTISTSDERNAKGIFINLAFKLLELSKRYKKMEQKSHDKDQEGLEDYINSLKFS